MANGLSLSCEQFEALPSKEKLTCLFDNQVKQFKRFDELEAMIRGYKVHQKIQYGLITALIAAAAFILKIHIGN